MAKLIIKLDIDYAQCPECTENAKGARTSLTTPTIEKLMKFIKKHRLHTKQAALNDWGYPRLVGRVIKPSVLKGQLLAIRIVDSPHEAENYEDERTQKVVIVQKDKDIHCANKKCKHYQTGCKTYCSDHDKCKFCKKASWSTKKEKKLHLKRCPVRKKKLERG